MPHVRDYLQLHAKLRLGGSLKELTIASGVVTADRAAHTIDTQSDAATDDLDTINGGLSGDLLVIYPASAARTVVLKHASGNIYNPAGEDVHLKEATDAAMLVHNGTNWTIVSASLLSTAPSLQEATGTILSAAVLALYTTPITVIAAPGAGRAIIVESCRWFLEHGGTTYAAGSGQDLVLKYTNGAGTAVVQAVDDADLPEASADESATVIAAATLTVIPNALICAHVLSGNWVTGDGDLHYSIMYRVVDYDLSD